MEFAEWRINVRASNTEPLLRLNIETKANQSLLVELIAEVSDLIQSNSVQEVSQ